MHSVTARPGRARRSLTMLVTGVAIVLGTTAAAAGSGDGAIGSGVSDVVAWGDNTDWQSSVPAGLTDVVAVSAGGLHSLALRRDGTVVDWGYHGRAGALFPPGLSGVVAIDAGYDHSLALTTDGTVVQWPVSFAYPVPADLTGVVAIDAGQFTSMALTSTGRVVMWGMSALGQAGAPPGLTDVTAISLGSAHALALRSDGTVTAWGGSSCMACDVPAGLTDVVAISAAFQTSLALRSDGTVVAWGEDWWGQRDVPAGLTDVVAISAGARQSVALRSDGTVVSWGYPALPVPAGLTDVVAISAGDTYGLALRSAPGTDAEVGFTVLEPVACLLLDTTAVDFGPVPLGDVAEVAAATTLTSCGYDARLLAAASRATSTAGTGASWSPVVPPDDGLCTTPTPTLNQFAYRLRSDTQTPGVYLTGAARDVGALLAGATRTDTHTLSTACPGSDGGEDAFATTITYTAALG